MTLDASTLKKIAPSMRRSLVITATGILAAGVLIFFAILPARTQVDTMTSELQTIKGALVTMQQDIANTTAQQQTNATRAAELQGLLDLGLLKPLLNSYAMRGKALLDPIAEQSGFSITSVKDSRFLRLQVPQPTPLQLYGRQLIEFAGQGAYTSIVSFISQTEASFPLCTLAGLKILGQPQNLENHRAFITFEWLAKGEKRSVP